VSLHLTSVLSRVYYRYPAIFVDAVTEHEPGDRLVAFKNVTISEEFFQGHFPGYPVLPAVLMIEALTQAAGVLVLDRVDAPPAARAALRLGKVKAVAYVDDQVVAEAELLLAIESAAAYIDPTAIVHPTARIGAGTSIGPNAVIGPDVRVGANCRIGASVVIEGWTEIGDGTQIFPMASIGLAPQDLKYRGERTRLIIGKGNVFREFVTINRGTMGGGGETTIGDHNLFMAYVHVAHDCHVGDETIFGPHATLGGHVDVEDYANISAGSAVHQFCRVGKYGFIGGYSVVTKDALPFARTIGSRPARIFGVNTIGLSRRGFTSDTISQLKQAYRYLIQSKLNTTRALGRIDQDSTLGSPEVRYLVDFIRSSRRGVILRRPARRTEELVADE
jgi:UDP-N-acetylglucosamine acyltransferase